MSPKEQVCRFAGEVDHIFIPDLLKLNRRTKAVRGEDIGKWLYSFVSKSGRVLLFSAQQKICFREIRNTRFGQMTFLPEILFKNRLLGSGTLK